MEKEAGCNVISGIIRRFSCGLTKSSEYPLPVPPPVRGSDKTQNPYSRRKVRDDEDRSAGVVSISRSRAEHGKCLGVASVQSRGSIEKIHSSGCRRREEDPFLGTKTGYRKLGDDKVMGNILRWPNCSIYGGSPGSKISAEALKDIGNERYKQGKFKEALVMYDQAIALDASKANYRSNRGAALIGMGRLLEALSECKEAVRIDPTHKGAHNRLTNLYIRLGEPEKALRHHSYAETIMNEEQVSRVEEVIKSLKRCKEARLGSKWSNLIDETDHAISLGVDSSPQVYAMKAEALLRLRRYQESFEAYAKSPRFEVQSCAKLYGRRATSQIQTVEALVYLTAGRFDAASLSSQEAVCIDPSNKEAIVAASVVKGVFDASVTGDLQFNASKFWEACVMYSEGLIHDPYNPVLLCNRAACFVKLKLFSKAMEDYTRALFVQPNYSEARRKRADCCVEMEKWEAAIKDYVMLEKNMTTK